MKKSVNVQSVGCRLNQFESDYIKSSFLSNNYKKTEKYADICIANTCTVTQSADRKSKRLIKKLKKDNPGAIMIATGCMVETQKDELAKLELVDMFVGNKDKMNIFDLVNKLEIADKAKEIKWTIDRTRPFIKIQDGCNHSCSYCKVREARGRSRSESFSGIIESARYLAGEGYQEIVLTGVNIGDWHEDHRKLKDLLEELIKIPELKRIRLSSIEPTELDGELIEVLKNEKICRYFHVPLQSGSEKILALMKRPYDPKFYKNVINKLKKIGRDVIIGTDVIVGFPGEKKEDFQRTYDLLKENNIFYLHIFRFSSREKTEAYSFPDKVPEIEKYKRYNELKEYAANSKMNYYKNLVGRNFSVIVGNKVRSKKYISSVSSNYVNILLLLSKYKKRIGKIVDVKVSRVDCLKVYGE